MISFQQYKCKAATAKKEYLKQLAAYRAVQISHQVKSILILIKTLSLFFLQTPHMHHLINQNSLPFNSHHTGSMITTNHQQFYPSPSVQQYNNYHYINHPYTQDNSNVYHSDRQVYFSNHHSHQTYPSYDSNNNYSDYQQYGLLRPVIESEQYSSYYDNEQTKLNENLLHNLNTKTATLYRS